MLTTLCMMQDILRALDIAGDVLRELSKVGQADQVTVDRLSREFLDIAKARYPSSDTYVIHQCKKRVISDT